MVLLLCPTIPYYTVLYPAWDILQLGSVAGDDHDIYIYIYIYILYIYIYIYILYIYYYYYVYVRVYA